MKIILSGGGTIGSVSPLLAVAEELTSRYPQVEFLWIATHDGPEQRLVSRYGIAIKTISSGKFRRYFSWQNWLDPFLVVIGFFQALSILIKNKPTVILSAGGYVAVPVVWAGWLLRIPSLIHQQDVRPGLANKLMAPAARLITLTFAQSQTAFPVKKTRVVGNPVRREILGGDRQAGYQWLGFLADLPVILVVGGGTGSRQLNELVATTVKQLTAFCQIIHVVGGRSTATIEHPRYRSFDFLDLELKNAYAVSDLVVCRAGMATLTEVAAVRKPTLVIPLPASHQVENAMVFYKHNAVALLANGVLAPETFVTAIKDLLDNPAERERLSSNISQVLETTAAGRMVDYLKDAGLCP